MRKLFAALLVILALDSPQAAILYQHQFQAGTPQACTSCIPQPPQLNRVWDAFQLSQAAEITAIEALLGFDASYPNSGTTAIDYSVWDQARASQLFDESFLPNQLGINLIQGTTYDVLAQFTAPHLLGPGTYYLSIFNGSQVEALGWNVSPVTLFGLSVQTIGPSFTPLPPQGSASGSDMAFRVLGDIRSVPEPGTVPLALVAATALMLLRGLSRCRCKVP